MNARHLSKHEYASLKAATRTVVHKLTGQGAASITRVGQQTLSTYGNPLEDFETVFMPVDVVADLEAELGDFPVTRALAELNNCLLVPMPEKRGTGPVAMSLGAALADGTITDREAKASHKEIREAIYALLRLDAVLAREVEGGD